MKEIYFFTMVSFIALTVHAQLVLNENFTGYATGNLNGQNRWFSEHSGADVVVSNANPLSYPTYFCGNEYIAVDSVLGKDPYKPFSSKIMTDVNKTVFMSFVVRINDVISNTSYFTLVLRDTFCLTPNIPCRFYVQKEYSPSNDIQFGVAVGSGTASFTTTDGHWSKGTTYLIVIRYDIVVNGPDRAYLWVNPSTFTEPSPGGFNTSSFAVSTTGEVSYGTQWNALQLFQSGNNTPKGDFDAFRVAEGTTSALAWQYLNAAYGSPQPVQQHFLLSPNPVSNILTIQHPKAGADAHIQIVSANGKMLQDLQLPVNEITTTVSMSGFTKGLYYVVFKNGPDLEVKKVLKM